MRKFCLSLLIMWAPAFAQMPSTLSQLKELQGTLPVAETPPAVQGPILERPIDPAEYVLGPGDRLQILIVGRTDQNISALIGPEGDIVIPSVGRILLANLTLQAGRERVIERLREVYRIDRIDLSLSELRKFRVSVSGAVANPQLVVVDAVSRLTDALLAAGGLLNNPETGTVSATTPPDRRQLNVSQQPQEIIAAQPANKPGRLFASRRKIAINRHDGQVLYADLDKFDRTGDLQSNPILLDGDRIVVPYQNLQAGKVAVDGAVRAPGVFEYLSGDTVGDLLALGHGLAADADTSHLILARFVGRTSQVEQMVLPLGDPNSATYAKTLAMPLTSDDRIWVRPQANYHLRYHVTVEGEIARPGIYAIDADRRWLSQILENAGGPTANACLNCAYLRRPSLGQGNDPELTRLERMQTQAFSEIDREYYKFHMRQGQGLIPLDLHALLQGGDKRLDLLLQDGDVIVLPVAEKSIAVFGQVINPGYYRYNRDFSVQDYINLAGGYNYRANKKQMRVIRDIGGEWLKPDNRMLMQDGDRIFVPEKGPKREWWDITKEVIAVASQVATVLLIVFTATDDSSSN
ncbi:MAG TPA: SLBB domain-containing protein [bacterium]|nr:SLBB domain-containing protein [bacterium]HNT64785.1 SLBB domain-containing protein [bacterium]